MRRYRLLLRLFPRSWRERYGDEVLRMLAEDEAESALRPSLSLVRSGLIERVHQFQRLVWSGVRFARGRAIALGAGLMVAAVAFSLLTSSVDVGTARIKGVVGRNWRGAYDLLVLPASTGASEAKPGHLVQENYLSEGTGGITVGEYHRIEALPGVGVAAPLEVVGYVLETAWVPVSLASVLGRSGTEVLTLTSGFKADNGLSTYPSQPEGYVFVTPNPLSPIKLGRNLLGPVETLPGGRSVTVCPVILGRGAPQKSPFENPAAGGGSCYSRRSTPPSAMLGYVAWSFPVLVAGIDPAAENQLTGLGRAVVSGNYLGASNGTKKEHGDVVVPVIASSVSFDGDTDDVTVGALPQSAVAAARSEQPSRIAQELADTKPLAVSHVTVTGADAWAHLVATLSAATSSKLAGTSISVQPFAQIVGQYWSVGQVRYRDAAGGEARVAAVDNPNSVWTSGINVGGSSYVFAPPAAADVAYRKLTEHLSRPQADGGQLGNVVLQAVGRFDPYKLAGFSDAKGSPLASYQAPLLEGANPASRAALGDQPLGPDGNMAGYAQQPPLLLTTMGGAKVLEQPAAFSGTSSLAAAPIGSIRVRLAGLRGTVPEELGKVAAVGQEITKATGLRVVVTAGSSPDLVTVTLPAGRFGRPPLQLSENWTAVMVALIVLRQADKQSLALFVLILVVCGLFLAGAALAAVRGRREEIAILRALGWGRHQVFALVLGEVAVLGVLAGAVGVAVSILLIEVLKLNVPLWRAALVLPVAAVLAVLSGSVPAWLAARTEPVGAFGPATRAPRRRPRPVRSITAMAFTDVSRTPGRCALAALALGAGVAGLAVLLAAQASFSQSIGDSALAGLVTASTRGTDLVSALLAVGLGAASVADISYLNLRERGAELAALAATGWGRGELGRLLVTEALITAIVGSVVGAVAGLLVAAYAFGLSPLVLLGAFGAAGAGVLAALAGTGAVLVFTGGASLTAALAADE